MSPELQEAATIIVILQSCLPDGDGNGGEDWGWCWNELTSESQELVKSARKRSSDFITKIQNGTPASQRS